jgi:SulP family sulfate permease
MFFASAGKILSISPKEDTKALVLRMRSVSTIDATAMKNLEILADDCKTRGVQLIMSHVNEQPMKVITKAGFYDKLGQDNFCPHIDDALARAESIVSKDKN